MNLMTPSELSSFMKGEHNSIIVRDALENFNSGKVAVFGVSGKKASGKDTIAEAWASILVKEYGLDVKFASFASHLKQEATSIIASADAVLNANVSIAEATERLARIYDIPVDQMADVFHLILPHIGRKSGIPDGWTRSEDIWALLRYLGTDIRQPQDKYFWVRKAFCEIVENAYHGKSTMITDARFLHEVEPLLSINGFIVRVDVSPEVQRQRLASRDGVVPDEAALNHASETNLDSYSHFDFRIDNSSNGLIPEKIAMIEAARKYSPKNLTSLRINKS